MLNAGGKLLQVHSLHADLEVKLNTDMFITMNGFKQRTLTDVNLLARVDFFKDPLLAARIDISVPILNQHILLYGVQNEENVVLYTSSDNGTNWERDIVDLEQLLQQIPLEEFAALPAPDLHFQWSGTEDVNGQPAAVYRGRIEGAYLRDLLSSTGATDAMAEAVENAVDADVAPDYLPNLRDILLTVMIDKESGLPVRLEADLSHTLQSLVDAALPLLWPVLKKAGLWVEGQEFSAAIPTLSIECTLSQFDALMPILIPEMALNSDAFLAEPKPTVPPETKTESVATERPTETPQPEAETAAEAAPADAPKAETQVNYLATTLKEVLGNDGAPCISIDLTIRPGDTLTIVLPHQEDIVTRNDKDTDALYHLVVYKVCYYPNTPVEDPVYTVTPQILVTHPDGTQESLQVDSFDLILPTVQLELMEPAPASIPAEGIMAAEGNRIIIKGKVDDHTVAVTVNDQPVSMYEFGYFEHTYAMTGTAPETVTIRASKNNCVSASYAFTVRPYVFVPQSMPLTVESDVTKLKADKNQKVTVTGMTAPGATLTATPAEEYQSSVVCGAPTVDAEGRFSFEVTFDKYYYGIATINLHAKKEGYEEGEASCMVSRMYADQNSAVKGYSKTKSYHEVYKYYPFDQIMADPSAAGLFRFAGKVTAVDPETGIVTVDVDIAAHKTAAIYVLNASDGWEPDKHVGDMYFLYCTLNGLYTDGASLYATAWFIRKTK